MRFRYLEAHFVLTKATVSSTHLLNTINISVSLGSLDVLVDLVLQDIQRPCTVQDDIMESLDIKAPPQCRLCSPPEFQDLDLTHLVTHSLTRPGHVPPHLPLNSGWRPLIGQIRPDTVL